MDRSACGPTSDRAAATPLVTVISPVYNQERHVAACVESALAQTYPHWEQVFVDDGSTDRTREIVAGYRDPRLRVLALPHRGLSALAQSYNAALAASTGTLIGILEGDDLWPPDKLARQVPLFDDPATVLSWGRATLVDDAGVPISQLATIGGRRPVVHLSTGEAFLRLTRKNLLTPAVTVMVRRSALEAVGGFHQAGSGVFVDLATWLRVTAIEPGQIAFANHVLGVYRVHADQASQRQRVRMARDHWRVVQELEATVGAETLARRGWDGDNRRRALSRDVLASGEIALAERAYAEAVRAFGAALRLGASVGDRAFALLGLASALARINVLAGVLALRDRARR